MPKIQPRPEIVEHPLYKVTMAAQQAAYQLMRDVPRDRKAEAALLNVSCVHATTYAQYALDPDVPAKRASWTGLRDAAREAQERLTPLVPVALEQRDTELLGERLKEIERTAGLELGRL